MNRADLVDAIAEATGQSKMHVHHTVSAMIHVISGAMAKGERVTLVGFGTFERRQRQARVGVNPQNPKQKLHIAAARVPAFRAGQELKDVVDGRTRMPALPKSVTSKQSSAPKKAKPAAAKKSAKKRKR